MKPPLKLLLSVLSIGLVIALAFFGWSVKAKDDATFRLANGVQVTPIEVKPDDVAQVLDAKIWKFVVVLPEPNRFYDYNLVLYRHGKFAGELGGFGIGPTKMGKGSPDSQVTIGMMPLDSTFSHAQHIKFSIETGAGGTNGVFENPTLACRMLSSDVQASQSDNLLYLMNGTTTNTRYGEAKLNDISIALSIQPSAMTVRK